MGRPRVSIVLLVYNNGDVLKRSLDSLLGQTFRDFEIIACDDASQDKSYEVLQEYAKKDSRINLLKHAKNQGVFKNLFNALESVRGEFLLWACPDDTYAPSFLQESLGKFEQVPGAVSVMPAMNLVFTKNNQILDNPPSYIATFRDLLSRNFFQLFSYGRGIVNFDESLGVGAQYNCFTHTLMRSSYQDLVFPKKTWAWGQEELLACWVVCLGGIAAIEGALYVKYQDITPLSERCGEIHEVYQDSARSFWKSFFALYGHVLLSNASFLTKLSFSSIAIYAICRRIIFTPFEGFLNMIVRFDQKCGSPARRVYRFLRRKG